MKIGLGIGISLLLLASAMPVQGQFGAWNLGIEYHDDNEDIPFNVDKEGRSTIQFFVDNEEVLDIEVEYEYEIPIGGAADDVDLAFHYVLSTDMDDLNIGQVCFHEGFDLGVACFFCIFEDRGIGEEGRCGFDSDFDRIVQTQHLPKTFRGEWRFGFHGPMEFLVRVVRFADVVEILG